MKLLLSLIRSESLDCHYRDLPSSYHQAIISQRKIDHILRGCLLHKSDSVKGKENVPFIIYDKDLET